MTKEAIQKEIERLEHTRFMLSMCDRWTQKDYSFDYDLMKKIEQLKKELVA